MANHRLRKKTLRSQNHMKLITIGAQKTVPRGSNTAKWAHTYIPRRKGSPPVILPDVVNPLDFNYSYACNECKLEDVRAFWERIKDTSSAYSDPSKTIGALKDDYQILFVTILKQHAQYIIDCIRSGTQPVPLKVLLLGTAGTGKTFCEQTLLQELQTLLSQCNLPASFIRAAAPTGSAAFNIKFNATTIHRLTHWFTPAFFSACSKKAPSL